MNALYHCALSDTNFFGSFRTFFISTHHCKGTVHTLGPTLPLGGVGGGFLTEIPLFARNDSQLAECMEALGGVLVQGTKWCGKTTTSVQHAGSVLYMDDPDTKEQNLAIAQTNIKLF